MEHERASPPNAERLGAVASTGQAATFDAAPVPASPTRRDAAWAKRLAFEAELRSRKRLLSVFDPAASSFAHGALSAALFLLGLRGRGRREAWDIQVHRREIELERLPGRFDGFRILHLSDLHLGAGRDFAQHVAACVQGLDADLVVVTGDFRFHKGGPIEPAMQAFARVREAMDAPVYAIFGNHDDAAMRAALEAMNVRVLVNEADVLRRGDEEIFLVGVDDPHLFRTDDLGAALEGVPEDACRVLLAHSPEPYATAAEADLDLVLCGHTHGGQIALPGGMPVIRNARCPRRIARGAWREGRLQGYTSVGTGYSTIDVRVNCPPEVVIHTLRAV